ncbi:hypothetical protein NPIL_652481, partial [Nephila pilipes]
RGVKTHLYILGDFGFVEQHHSAWEGLRFPRAAPHPPAACIATGMPVQDSRLIHPSHFDRAAISQYHMKMVCLFL